jgi:plastocyanin
MSRLLALLTFGVLALGFGALDSAAQDKKDKDTGKKHEVIMEDNKFKPEKIIIEVGDTIVWVNKGKTTHAASSDEGVKKDFEFDTEDIDAGKMSKPIKFSKEGVIRYSCFHHAGMTGEITVKAKKK